MAKYQWTAASETLGAAPALLEDVCDGSLADWQIVDDVGGYGGRAAKIIGAPGARRRLALPGVVADSRVDVRGFFYKASDSVASLHTFLRNNGTSASDGIDFYGDVTSSETLEIAQYSPSYASRAYIGMGGANTIGWWNIRYTFDPNATPIHTLKAWPAGDIEANAIVVTSNVAPNVATNGRVGFGTGTSSVSGGMYSWITVGTDADDADVAPTGTADTSEPTLTSLAGSANGSTAATGSVTTTETGGTLYAVASTSATPPSVAQIQIGQDASGTVAPSTSKPVSNTSETFSISGLSAGTTYYLHAQHEDAAGNDSAVVTSAAFTTAAAPAKGVRITLHVGATPQAGLTGIRALWWDAAEPTGAPVYETTTASTDGSGVLTLDLDAVTSLAIGANGFLLLYKLDATNHEDSRVFAGRVALSDIS